MGSPGMNLNNQQKDTPMIIGLTGGIGSGKSTVSRYLRDAYGCPVVDADAIAHAVTAPGGRALTAIAEVFGADFVTACGELDRRKMRALIAKDVHAKKKLEAIEHPIIQQAILEQFEELRQAKVPLIIYDCPVFFQAHQETYVDVVAVVICDRAIRIARICKRDGIDEDLANRMVALQMSDAEMTARADVVFDNSGETSDLYRCVDHWMMALKKHEKK